MNRLTIIALALAAGATQAQTGYTGPIPDIRQPQVDGVPYVGVPPRGGSYTGRVAGANEPSVNGRPIVSPSEYEGAYARPAQRSGGMVSGHYVAPSAAQHAADLMDRASAPGGFIEGLIRGYQEGKAKRAAEGK